MKGRQRGRPTKWVAARLGEAVGIGKPGVTFEVWEKWKRKGKKLGTLTVSVGGLRWWPQKSPKYRRRTWEQVAALFEGQ